MNTLKKNNKRNPEINNITKYKKGNRMGYIFSRIILMLLLLLTFYPLYTLINMSFKQDIIIKTDFLGLPQMLDFSNYTRAIKDVILPVGNSLFVCLTVILATTVIVALSGYAYGKMKFYGKEVFYNLVLIVLMIPNVLLIIPTFQIVNRAGWNGSFLGLIMPYISGMQLFGIIISRAFFEALPDEMFEAGKIDGAGEMYLFLKIALPLAKPVLITAGITSFIAMYNDYIWPSIVLSGKPNLSTFCQIAFNNAGGNGSTDLGYLAAFFVLGTIPLIIICSFLMKYYLQGMVEGAVKS